MLKNRVQIGRLGGVDGLVGKHSLYAFTAIRIVVSFTASSLSCFACH